MVLRFKKVDNSLLIIVAIALFLRLFLLNVIPPGITNDEIDSIINAKSFFLTGQILKAPKGELNHILISPIVGPLPFSLATARLPYALASAGTVVVLYLLIKKLFGKRQALFVGLVGAANPWGIIFGRTSYEAVLSTFFYFLAIYLVLNHENKRILLAFVPFAAALFTYIGTKLIFLPVVFLALVFAWYLNNKKHLGVYAALFAGLFLVFILYVLAFKLTPSAYRTNEIIPNMRDVGARVERNTNLSLANPLNKVFSNKATVILWDYLDRYLGAFSPQLLFLTGEGNEHFSLWYSGYFYLFDLFLLPFGAVYLLKTNKKLLFFLTALVLAAPIPSVLSQNYPSSYVFRSSLLFPTLVIFSGLGAYFLYLLIRKRAGKVVLGVLVIAYLIMVLNFLQLYFVRSPVYNSEFSDFSAHELSGYISLAVGENKPVRVITSEPEIIFGQYIFYRNLMTRANIREIGRMYRENSFSMPDVSFGKCPKDNKVEDEGIVVVKIGLNCEPQSKLRLKIGKIADAGSLYYIYNDSVCANIDPKTYTHKLTIGDLKIENLNREEFCSKYVLVDI